MKYNRLILITLLFIILTLIIRWWVADKYASELQNARYIETNIQTEVLEQEYDMITVLDSLSLHGFSSSFGTSISTAYPYFIFLDGSLKFWSDSHFVPDYTTITTKSKYSYIDNFKGKYIVRKWVVDHGGSTYEVFSLISLYQKYPINNVYIQSGINSKIGSLLNIEISGLDEEGYKIAINKEPICTVQLNQNYKPAIVQPFRIIDFTIVLLLVALFLLVYRFTYLNAKRFEVLVLVLGWMIFKLVLPNLSGITTLSHINLFDPQYYAVSWFETSFGSLLINTIFILLISFKIEAWFRSKSLAKLVLHSKSKLQNDIFSILMILATFWIINYPFFQLRSIYNNSQVSIDISKSLQFEQIKILTYVVIVLVSISTFLLYHSAIRYIVRLTPSLLVFVKRMIGAVVLYLPLSYLANMPFANFAWVNILILSILWYFKLAKSLNAASYKRLLYIISIFGLFSAIYGYMIAQFEIEREVINTKKIIAKKLDQADPFAEFLLSTALTDLSDDPFIISRMASPFLSKNAVTSKIKRVFLNSYLNTYDQSILLYDSKGSVLLRDDLSAPIFSVLNKFGSDKSITDYPSVFRINSISNDFSKHYIGYTTVKKQNAIVGYVLLEFKERQFSSPGVYPELLLDNRFKSADNRNNAFAYYLNNKLINATGSHQFPVTLIKDKGNGWEENNKLYVLASDDERAIIATIVPNKFKTFLSNFSFIWLITLVPILLFWLLILVYKRNGVMTLSYTDRIIWYLNLAFIIPLILVTSVTFRLLSNSFEKDSMATKMNLVKRISNQLSFSLIEFLENASTLDVLVERLNVLSNNTQFDVNLFNLGGELIVSSRPDVYNRNVLAPFINPHALNFIKNKVSDYIELDEKIGSLSFKSSYTAIRSANSGELLGILSVPFFNTQTSLEASKREAFNTILNVFVIVLFVTMLFTYFAGQWLTNPLKIIRDKLKNISFNEKAEPINIQWSDELGMLIKAYNQMLISLEQSKGALKKSEKEKAWREAAQQVAHEIKNPLTPMKLTLQRIDNKIRQTDVNPQELVVPLQSVLDQVETLNSIASSFSEFAQMPTPFVDRVEIHAVICKVVELFSAESELQIKLQLVDMEVYSMVDPKILARIINNLLLNAKQAIKPNQDWVEVELSTYVDNFVRIQLKDNGGGIDLEIADKVFIPRFTTKEQGLGIGLAMTKYGVENMGGKIYFESIINEGTIFTIEFPIIK